MASQRLGGTLDRMAREANVRVTHGPIPESYRFQDPDNRHGEYLMNERLALSVREAESFLAGVIAGLRLAQGRNET